MHKIKIGIIGIGSMGAPVSQLIAIDKQCPELELTAICDKNKERLEWAEKTFKGQNISLFENAEEMMDSGVVDAVYIAVPHYDHPKLAMMAFEKGHHVMLEKPAGVYTKVVREMNAAAKRAGVKFGMMFQNRTIAAYKKVKELLDSGAYGQIRNVTWIVTKWFRAQSYYDSGSWRATWAGEGGGVLLNQCPHQLDLLQWLCGMPEEIYAKCSVAQWHDVEIEDDVAAILKYKNGAHGSFITSTGIAPGTNRLEISTDKGTIIVDASFNVTIHELDISLADYKNSKTQAQKVTQINYTFSEEKLNRHCIALNAFAGAILRGEELVANGEEGLNSLILSNAMYLSAWTNASITLPFNEDLFYEELQKRVATSKHKDVKDEISDATTIY